MPQGSGVVPDHHTVRPGGVARHRAPPKRVVSMRCGLRGATVDAPPQADTRKMNTKNRVSCELLADFSPWCRSSSSFTRSIHVSSILLFPVRNARRGFWVGGARQAVKACARHTGRSRLQSTACLAEAEEVQVQAREAREGDRQPQRDSE